MSLNPFEVEIIGDDSENQTMAEAYGIEPEREIELVEFSNGVFRNWDSGNYGNMNYSTLVAMCSEKFENANELAFIVWQLAFFFGQYTPQVQGFIIQHKPRKKK